MPGIHWFVREQEGGLVLNPGVYRMYLTTYQEIKSEKDIYLWSEGEALLFRRMAREGLNPGYAALEVTTYPMGWGTAILPETAPKLYSAFSLTQDWNLWESLGAGFQEPWSISLFLGDMATIWDLDSTYSLVPVASGASGWVLTAGSQELISGRVTNDRWSRLEWKLKGSNRGSFPVEWDIKIGYRWEANPDRPDGLTFRYYRENFASDHSGWAGNNQIDIRLRWATGPIDYGPLEIKIAIGKAIFWKGHKIGIILGVDQIFDNLETDNPKQDHLIFQPFILWN